MKRFVAALTMWMWGTACLAVATTDEVAAVRIAVQKVFAAYKAGDVDTLATSFLPDVSLFVFDGALRVKGANLSLFKTLYDAYGYRLSLQAEQLDVTVYDTTALATGYIDGTIILGKNKLEGPWRLSVVLRKQDGVWKIAHTHQSPLIPAPQQPVAVRFPDAIVGGLSRPAGSGPFPAVVLVPGCAGPIPNDQRWAKVLQEWGYVTLLVDSFGPRGIKQTCTDFFRINNAQRALDAYAALRYLASQPFVDSGRIGVVGWSAGGTAVLETIQAGGIQTALDLPHGGFKAAVVWYPYCPPLDPFDMPLLILTGEKDAVTPAARCEEMTASIKGKGIPVTLKVYAGATHTFDVPTAEIVKTFGQGMTYHAQATAEATDELKGFLAQHLRGTGATDQTAGK